MFLVDSHCHFNLLDLPANDSIDQVVTRARANGVHAFLNVCVKISDFPAVLATAKAYPFVSCSLGLHPNEQDEAVTGDTLLQLGQEHKVVAIGETGLDYYRSEGDVNWQRERFVTHIEAAKQLKKPLIIHTRQAKHDTIALLREHQAQQVRGVMHCFTEEWETAKAALDLDFYISISGMVTFKNATVIQDVAKRVPLDRLLIETDSPYLAPIPMRGKPNEPAYVRYTGEFIANLRQTTPETLAEQTTHNFFDLFKGAVKPHV